jgi:hypothetical protein
MITTEQCRALLSTEIELTESELEELRNDLYSTAELAFESYWLDSNSGSKNPVGLLDGSRSTDTV